MKRFIMALLAGGAILYNGTLFAQETFQDNFSSVSYSNNDGSQNWSSDWIETDDIDLGPNGTYIYINGGQLTFNYIWTENIRRSLNLNGATTASVSFDWQTSGLTGQKGLRLQASTDGGASYSTVGSVSGNNSSGTFTADFSAFISSNTIIRFTNTGNDWDSNDFAYVDNLSISVNQLNPFISIDDVSIDESVGTVTLTATHSGVSAGSSFTVNYSTFDGTAVVSNDYSLTTGTLNFNGTSGDTETITIPIINDTTIEGEEQFDLRFTSSSNGSIDISDVATITINSQIPFNQPLALYEQFAGYIDYTSAAGTFRTADNNTDPCAITSNSSGTLLSAIPSSATIQKAYLYWAHSSYVTDPNVTFEGRNVTASLIYETSISPMTFYGYVSDVTSIIEDIGVSNLGTNTFDVTDLIIDNSTDFCSTSTVMGGWSLMIFYEEDTLPAANINLYLGFDGLSNAGTSFTLDSFYAIAGTGSKASFLSWEGDSTLDGSSAGSTNPEELSITNQAGSNFILSGDGGNTGNNAYNSTAYDNTQIPVVNISTLYGLDWDTFDISTYIGATDSQVTANVDVGQDFVISNAVVLKVPSNLATGYVFEDVNYPGGAGRNRSTSSGTGISGATVELYNSSNSLITSATTNNNGQYVFGGMPDGTYYIRAVNNTLRSNRGGGSTCTDCFPVQTFRAYNSGSGLTEVLNEVGGSNPAQEDTAAGSLSGAQSVSEVFLSTNGVVNIDFGFNFNTIVNTNNTGQGSLAQFIQNANSLDESGLDIEANSIFDPVALEDLSIFMIPTTTDPQGRTTDPNYSNGYFSITPSAANPLPNLTSDNTVIDGRTQTAYSGDTNNGVAGTPGTLVGTSGIALPSYELPEIEIFRNNGDVFISEAENIELRYMSIHSNSNSGIRLDTGSITIQGNLIGVNAQGNNTSNIAIGIENLGGNMVVNGNYIAYNQTTGVLLDGGSSSLLQTNHFTNNGSGPCDDSILVDSSTGVVISQNLFENSGSTAIDASLNAGSLVIDENSIRTSGTDGGNCGGAAQQMGIILNGSNSQITNNSIYSNGGSGLSLEGSGTANLISQNSFYANGTSGGALGIDLQNDGITLNDSGDLDTGVNELLNFPIIQSSILSGNTITISGWSRPGATLEFFFTDINEGTASQGDNQIGLSQDYGEGQVYIGTGIEGDAADLDNTSSSYSDIDGNNGNTNRFKFTFTLAMSMNLGGQVTSTARLSNSTSEFGPISLLKLGTIITNRRITYRFNMN